MRNSAFVFFLSLPLAVYAQKSQSVAIADFVKIKDGKINETIFFYENNWKVYRDIALKRIY
ncbi:MAG: hypothetical protein U5K54_26080 [Cytophagales bacterium]|nr:hypothetical protein [Cytophagales bacterium]